MSILNKLSSSLGRTDEQPNLALAEQVLVKNDMEAVELLVAHLQNKSKLVQHDCIKVLYEIGFRNPGMIAGHVHSFVALLDSQSNRLQWGAMTALDYIASEVPKTIFEAIPKILEVADKGSVITNDHCVGILVKLCEKENYYHTVFKILITRLEQAPGNQLPMYAEKSAAIVGENEKRLFTKTLEARLRDLEKPSKRKRIESVIKKVNKR